MSKSSDSSARSNVHPIAGVLLRSLRPSEGSEYSIPTECLREIGATLERLEHTPEFLPAVTTLIRFCQVLEGRGAKAAAHAIAKAARGVVPELERLTGAGSAAQAAVARERFARLLGEARPMGRPARGGERGPGAQSMLALRASAAGSR